MRQIVPFKKDIKFKSKIGELVSISLDHDLTLKDDDTLSGYFYLKGTYKMLPTSEIETEYSYKIPVEIAISDNYDAFLARASIDDFNYEIDGDVLRISVDVLIDNLERREEKKEEEPLNDVDTRNIVLESEIDEDVQEEAKRCYDKEEKEEIDVFEDIKPQEKQEDESSKEVLKGRDDSSFMKDSTSFFQDEEESYLTYSVYLVKEEDTVDDILKRYAVDLTLLQDYNDLTNVTPGMKLIIPNIANND